MNFEIFCHKIPYHTQEFFGQLNQFSNVFQKQYFCKRKKKLGKIHWWGLKFETVIF